MATKKTKPGIVLETKSAPKKRQAPKAGAEDHPEDDQRLAAARAAEAEADASGGDDQEEMKTADDGREEEIIRRDWKSGDYREDGDDNPVSGVEIRVHLTIREDSETGKVRVAAMRVEFFDYTAGGGQSEISDLSSDAGWAKIPPAEGQSEAYPNGQNFSISGDVKIQQELNGSFLRVRFSYATDPSGKTRRDERGFILGLDVETTGDS